MTIAIAGKRRKYTPTPRRWDPLDRQPREMERDSDLDLKKRVWGVVMADGLG
jgi:hypothetical protein